MGRRVGSSARRASHIRMGIPKMRTEADGSSGAEAHDPVMHNVDRAGGILAPVAWGEPSMTETDPGFALPVGTVTLLLADIEGSTRLWEDGAPDMAEGMARYDRLVSDTVAVHEGVRPVEQGEGDSFVAAFARASDAIACALDLQLALARDDLPFRVRMALHTGEVQRRGSGNYAGSTVNRCARIRALGHGGQTLLSKTTCDLVADSLPPGASVADRGVHRLRDLSRPEHIFELRHPDLASVFPPLRSLDAARHNLPVQLSTFIGRNRELSDLTGLLSGARLLTLTGAGGCGKTRLALQLGADSLDGFADGVWFVDAAPLTDATDLPAAVAVAMGLGESHDADANRGLAGAIGGAQALVVLDNCEHLVAACAALADVLLRMCPALTVVATSREPLGVEGEITYRVPSLSVPGESAPTPIEAVDQYEAVALFFDRARRAQPSFTLGEDNVDAVSEICRRLDGIPLAIELAAARVRVLSPGRILTALHDRFRLLAGGARTAVPRQQTLLASVDWSYALLQEPERVVLRRLAAFAGSLTVGDAEAVCCDDVVAPHHVAEILFHLVDKSLVVGAGDRFRLLETVRQYAAGRLVDAGETATIRNRHLDHVIEAARVQPGETDREFRARLDPFYEDVRRALQWAAELDEPGQLLRLVGRLFGYWAVSPHTVEALRWCTVALDKGAEGPAHLRARVLRSQAQLRGFAGQWTESIAPITEAYHLYKESGDERGLAWACMSLANIYLNTGRGHEAMPYVEEGLAVARRRGDTQGEVLLLHQVGIAHNVVGDPRGAADAWRQGMAIADATGFEYGAFLLRGFLADVVEPSEGVGLLEVSLEGLARMNETFFVASHLGWLISLRALNGDLDGARRACAEAAELSAQVGDPHTRVNALLARMYLAMGEGDIEAARAVAHEAIAFDGLEGYKPHRTAAELAALAGDTDGAEALVAASRGIWSYDRVGIDERVEPLIAWQRGDLARADALADAALDQAVASGSGATQAATMPLVALLAAERGNAELAVRLLAAATETWKRWGYEFTLPWWRAPLADAAADVARKALDPDRFDALWAEGAALSLDAALAYARRGRGERRRTASGWTSLTPTEHEVVKLVSDGLSNAEIAERLFVSRRTVTTHLTHVYTKLGVSSRTELASLALKRAPT